MLFLKYFDFILKIFWLYSCNFDFILEIFKLYSRNFYFILEKLKLYSRNFDFILKIFKMYSRNFTLFSKYYYFNLVILIFLIFILHGTKTRCTIEMWCPAKKDLEFKEC